MDETTSVRLIEALTRIWSAIRANHADVPPVVLLAAPAPRGQGNVLGHFAPLRWSAKKSHGHLMHEVVVVAEHLNRTGFEVLETLLHEAAHSLSCNRGIRDCTASQYHNRHFRDAALELGLDVAQVSNYGYAYTTLPLETARRYEAEAHALDSALVHRRTPPQTIPPPRPPADDDEEGHGHNAKPTCRLIKAACECGFIIRVSRKTLVSTTIRCDTCDSAFHVPSP